jgi:hypothetical protein
MKRIYLFSTLSLLVLGGCTQSQGVIKAHSSSVRTDVVEESRKGGKAPAGYLDLKVSSTLKTHPSVSYPASDKHGTADYLLLVNIDGQALHLEGDRQKENSEALNPADPDAGDGIRYRFGKHLRLKAGNHKLVVALPEDGIVLERELRLSEGDFNELVLKPVYGGRRDSGRKFRATTNFREGIRSFKVVLNGEVI